MAVAGSRQPGDVAVDATHVYWSEGGWGGSRAGLVRRAPLGTADVEDVIELIEVPAPVATDPSGIGVWVAEYRSARRFGPSGQMAELVLPDDLGPGRMAVD